MVLTGFARRSILGALVGDDFIVICHAFSALERRELLNAWRKRALVGALSANPGIQSELRKAINEARSCGAS
jgi:hypothetical protein